jgi:[ribosomal protein S18]-alanine N-acetyltransferase
MGLKDLPEVLELERICFSDPWAPEAFREEVRRGSQGLNRVLRVDGRLCAYSISWVVADEVHLANLAVDPLCRRQGLAAALLDDLLAEGRRRRASVVWLEVRAGNQAAIRLYEKYGFRRMYVRKNYYTRQREDALVMVRPVPPEEEQSRAPVRKQEGRNPAGA